MCLCKLNLFMVLSTFSWFHRLSCTVCMLNVHRLVWVLGFCHKAAHLIHTQNQVNETRSHFFFLLFISYCLAIVCFGKNKNKLFIRCPFFLFNSMLLLLCFSFLLQRSQIGVSWYSNSFFCVIQTKSKSCYWYCFCYLLCSRPSLFITTVWILNLCSEFQFLERFFSLLFSSRFIWLLSCRA